MRKKIIAGNWKMYKTTAEAVVFAKEFKNIYQPAEADAAICAPFMQLAALSEEFAGSPVAIGAQNMNEHEQGAFTGEIAPAMLTEIGIGLVIIGHSERRQYFAETNITCNQKLITAFKHGITPIYCVGEVLAQRESGEHINVVDKQVEEGLSGLSGADVSNMIIAYEPVWAIGTGKVAKDEEAQEMCKAIRTKVASLYGQGVADSIRIQYGGSVKPENARAILTQPDIDGALVGGASLEAESFLKIVNF